MAIEKNNRTKEFRPDEPFVRINSREYAPEAPLADGKGLDCGCRNSSNYDSLVIAALIAFGLDELEGLVPIPDELKERAKEVLKSGTEKDFDDFKKEVAKTIGNAVEGLVFGSLLRNVPTWVPVNRRIVTGTDGKKKFDPNFKERDKEVAGILSRSFQSFHDLPHLPWQRFYNWDFHVRVDPNGVAGETPDGRRRSDRGGFLHVVGEGNKPNDSERSKLGESDRSAAVDINTASSETENSLECIIDTGAFSKSPGNAFDVPNRPKFDVGGDILPGVMFHPRWPFWPMTNDYFWAQGRWVYDCSHFRESRDKIERHWTQLHPVRAFACCRQEGFKFDENDKRVPATRFLFFSCRKGGYHDFPAEKLDSKDDPQFIVDLPPPPVSQDLTWTIGHTEHFDMNTGVLRPRLLIKTEFAPFGVERAFFQEGINFAEFQPIIEPIRSKPDKTTFDQVKITIPLSQMPAGKAATDPAVLGMVTSLGWADPTNEQAARVKKVTIQFDGFRKLRKRDELRFKFCVNGHWVYAPMHKVKDGNLPIGGPLTLFLPDDAVVSMSVHGLRRRGYGEALEEERDSERQLHIGGLFGGLDLEDEIKDIKDKLEKGEKIFSKTGVEISPLAAKGLLKGLEVAAEVFSKQRDVKWLEHVDQLDDTVASSVARALFFKRFFDLYDEPVGFVDSHLKNNFGFGTEIVSTGGAYVGDEMVGLVKDFKEGRKSRTITVSARQMDFGGNAHMLVFNSTQLPPDEGREFQLQFTINIEDQP